MEFLPKGFRRRKINYMYELLQKGYSRIKISYMLNMYLNLMLWTFAEIFRTLDLLKTNQEADGLSKSEAPRLLAFGKNVEVCCPILLQN